MQKEITNPSRLYTAIFEYHNSLFIHQFWSRAASLIKLTKKWAQVAVKEKIISNREDKNILYREIASNKHGDALGPNIYIQNSWLSYFSLTKGLNSLMVVRTAEQDLNGTTSQKQTIWEQHRCYANKYEDLKNCLIKDREVAKERKKCERWMQYWGKKQMEAATNQGNEKAMYSIVLGIDEFLYIQQHYIEPGQDINDTFQLWVEGMKTYELDDRYKSCDERIKNKYKRIYTIIAQRSKEPIYRLQPVAGLVNVWSTYFTLSTDLGSLFVIRTHTPAETMPEVD